MNAPEKITAAEPMNAAHEILMKAASGMCSQEIAAAITGTPRPTKPQIKATEKMLKAIHDCGMLASQPGRGGVALYSLTTPVSNINEMGDVSLVDEGETAEVCDLVQTGSGSQAEDSPISDEVCAQMQSLNTVTSDEFSLLNVIADIRAAIGDPEGKIMLGDLAAHIQRDIGELIESLEVEKRVSGSAISAVAHICEHLGCDDHNGHVPVLHAIDGLHAQIATLTTKLSAERQAREALQERADVVDAEFVAPRLNAKGYALKVPKRPLRRFGKEAAAKSAAMAAARLAGRGEVFALVPVGKAVRGAEWKGAR